jgi:putative flippase GtrA
MTGGGDHARFLRFLAVGLLNTGFGYALYALLVWVGLSPQPALALSFAAGVMWNYMTHARLVFDQAGFRRLLPYVGAYLAIYLVNAAALQIALRAGLAPLLAQALLVLPMAALAFMLISRVLTGRLPFLHAAEAEGQKR